MSMPLLVTKLHRPICLTQRVERPALRRRLRSALQRKVTLVSAPVGFGKTALVADWCNCCECPTAWLTLDEEDNDPVRFWSYFIAGLCALYPAHSGGVGFCGRTAQTILHASHPPPVDIMMVELVNELAGCEGGGVFVLDDFHTIRDPSIHDALIFLVDNLPATLHLIIATRQDPPWPLARLRAAGQIHELRAADLRFSIDETVAFLNGIERLDLLPGDIAALNSRVEGWVAGLQLVALSLRHQPDVASFIHDLSGSERFVLDYLLDEVLLQQPEPLQEFLLKTSILERLCADLCDEVVGDAAVEVCRQIVQDRTPALLHEVSASQAVLHHLEAANLFVSPLDSQGCWYRYHLLFADLLQNRLDQCWPSERTVLHQRASRWYEAHGFIADAIAHALAGDAVERVTQLLEGNALLSVYHGELAQLNRWLDALPSALLHTRPWLAVARGWVLALTGQLRELSEHLDRAESHLRRQNGQQAMMPDGAATGGSTILAHFYALKMYADAVETNVDAAFHNADLALRQLPPEPSPLRDHINLMLGTLYHRRGDLAAAEDKWLSHVTRCRATGNLLDTVSGLAELAALQIEQGQLHRAHVTCREALQMAGGQAENDTYHISFMGKIYLILSTLQLEWNELEGALQMAHQGKEIAIRWGQAEGMLHAHMTLANALQAVGDAEGALDAMSRAGETAHLLSPWHIHRQEAEAAQLWIAQGNVAAAVTWADRSGLRLTDSPTYLRHTEYLTLAQVRLLQSRLFATEQGTRNELAAVIQLLARLFDLCTKTGSTGTSVRVLILLAIAHHVRSDEESALAVLAQALALAEPEGYIGAFLTARSACIPLLQRWVALHGESVYVGELLHTAYARRAFDANHSVAEDIPNLTEPLSPREQDVLSLLPSNLSTVEIAARLMLAPSTVRSHVKNIYAKLQAHGRSEALATARRFGLL